MNFILFIHQDSLKKGITLKNIIDKNFYGTELQTLHTLNSFKERLKKSIGPSENEIFILLAESQSRLNELTSLIDLLEGKRTILILPDESKATLSMASEFFPRFFTPMGDTYNDLCDVLNKMANQKQL
jgi:hypothetical protein